MNTEDDFGYKWASSDIYPILKDYARKNRKNPTQSESILWNALRKELKPFRFRRQYIIGDFIADFVCLAHKLIIEVDGAYHSEPQQAIKDSQRSTFLKSIGFKVIRFTNEDINNDIRDVINRIKLELYSNL